MWLETGNSMFSIKLKDFKHKSKHMIFQKTLYLAIVTFSKLR